MSQKKETKYYGYHACFSLWKNRPQDIIRVYLTEENLKTLSPVLKWCASQKKAYHIIPAGEMARVTDSIHHEGVAILALEPDAISEKAMMAELSRPSFASALIYLDGVENPHNLGSILRTCAHFGIPFVLGEEGKMPPLSPSAVRVARGAAEQVRVVFLKKPSETLLQLKKMGFTIIETSSHTGVSLYRYRFSPRSVIVLGSESSGVGKSLRKAADAHMQIPGSGWVESLNVSVAAALCLGEFYRQHAP